MPNNTSDSNLMNIQYPTVYSSINRYDINNKPFITNKLWDISSGSLTTSVQTLTGIFLISSSLSYGKIGRVFPGENSKILTAR